MELEDEVEDNMKEGDEVGSVFVLTIKLASESDIQYLLQLPVGSLTSDGNVVFESLDKLMVLSFDHLESCKLAGRLDQVWHQIITH